ncbi:hypothetical protein [Nonomuraea sp. NPDC049158]
MRPRRTATLLAVISSLDAEAIDDALDLFAADGQQVDQPGSP